MTDFTFLTKEQCSSEKLKILEKRGIIAPITDFAILLGCSSFNYHYNKSKALEDRSGSYWTTTNANNNNVSVNNGFSSFRNDNVRFRDNCARPAITFSSISNILHNITRGVDGILEVEYGEYPQKAASKKLQNELENAYKNNYSSISKTGKTYTTDSRKYDEYDKEFEPQIIEEYLFDDGKKYVRVKAKYSDRGYNRKLSNGEEYYRDDYVWVEVRPIKWLIDEKSGIALSERLLFAGVQFKHDGNYEGDFETTDIKKFMDEHFSKDIVPSLQKIEEQKQTETKPMSEEEIKKALEKDITLLQYMPLQYQTIEYQKKLIDKKASNISMIDTKVLSDEIIYYALNIDIDTLENIPNERRTYEICDYALKLSTRALKSIPNEFKTSQMCFDVVVKDPIMIRYVPVEILNEEFVNALNQVKVIIPLKYRDYVNECLDVHKKVNSFIDLSDPADIEKNIINNDNLNIKLEEMEGLLSSEPLKVLINKNILTVKNLLEISNNREFYLMLLNMKKYYYIEIVMAIKLLRCQFLNVDPFIDIGSEKSMNEIFDALAFSVRTRGALIKKRFNTEQFFEALQDNTIEEKVGKKAMKEILYKTSIVMNYYKKQENQPETLESLNEELEQAIAEIKRLEARKEEILVKIQQRELLAKGGVTR